VGVLTAFRADESHVHDNLTSEDGEDMTRLKVTLARREGGRGQGRSNTNRKKNVNEIKYRYQGRQVRENRVRPRIGVRR
jgi:hypothetical protein